MTTVDTSSERRGDGTSRSEPVPDQRPADDADRTTSRWQPSPRTRTVLAVVAEVAAVVFTLALRYWTTRGRVIYSVTSDEASQLAMARTLSGARPFHVVGPSYDAGFGILLAPIYAVVDDPELAYRLVLLTNVLLAGVTLFVLRALVRRLLDVPGPAAIWAGAVALALPGATTQTLYTGSEVLVVLVVAVLLWLVVEVRARDDWWPAIALALMGAVAVLVHARLLGMVVVVAFVLVAGAVLGDTRKAVAGVSVVVLVGATWAAMQLNTWVYELVWLPTSREIDRLGGLLDNIGPPVVMSTLGMTWHQVVTTFGLVVIGVGWLVATAVRSERPRIGPEQRTRWAILLLLAAAAVPAAIFMSGTKSAPKMVYGRYWDPLAVPLVALGVGYLLQVGHRIGTRVLSAAMLASGVFALLFSLVRQADLTAAFEARGFGNPRRVAGLMAFLEPSDGIAVLAVTGIALAGMALVLALAVLNRRQYGVAVVVGLVLVASVATVRATATLDDRGSGVVRWRPAMELDEQGIVPNGATVAFQLSEETYDEIDPKFPFTAYQFYETDVTFVGVMGDEALDYEWVVSDDTDPLLTSRGWEQVYVHPNGRGVVVWQRP